MAGQHTVRVLLRGPDGLYRGRFGARVERDEAAAWSPAAAAWLRERDEQEERLP